MRPGVVVLAVWLAGCGSSKSAAPARAQGQGFSVPVPAGWVVIRGDEREELVGKAPSPDAFLLLRQRPRKDPTWFVGSVVMQRIALGGSPSGASDEATCRATADALAAAQGVAALDARIEDAPRGPRCRLSVGDDRQHALFYVVDVRPDEAWTMTCNHDPRDAQAVRDCTGVVDGVELDPAGG